MPATQRTLTPNARYDDFIDIWVQYIDLEVINRCLQYYG